MKKYLYTIVILFFTLNIHLYAQEQNLAKIGNIELSAKEFKHRFEFTPKVKSDFDSTKVNFLYSIIAEKLWALEAESLSMDTIPYVYNSVKNIEKKLVKDKLYKIEVESKVIITESEITENLFKISEKRTMNFLFSKDKNEIEQLYNKLVSGVSFNSLIIGRMEQNQQVNGIPVVFGQMDEKLENIVYLLKLHKFTKPVPLNVGWVIYYLKSIEVVPLEDRNDEKANRKIVEDILFARKAKVFYDEFFNKYIKGNTVYADKQLSHLLENTIFDRYHEEYESLYNENTKQYQFDQYKIKTIREMFTEEELSRDFIKFEISPVSLEKYLLNLELNGFSSDKMSKYAIFTAIAKDVKSYIFEELLIREGYSRGLQNSKEIKNELITWRESFLASYYRHSFLDSIEADDNEAKDVYDKIVSESSDSTTETFDDVKEKIKTGLFFKELENLYIDKTVALAEKYGVSVDTELLNRIQVTDIEMMVYRSLGFGGKITAVPYLQSFYTWKNWLPRSLKKRLP